MNETRTPRANVDLVRMPIGGADRRRALRTTWPINEILLQALILQGKSDCEIARMHGIQPEDVVALREALGL